MDDMNPKDIEFLQESSHYKQLSNEQLINTIKELKKENAFIKQITIQNKKLSIILRTQQEEILNLKDAIERLQHDNKNNIVKIIDYKIQKFYNWMTWKDIENTKI